MQSCCYARSVGSEDLLQSTVPAAAAAAGAATAAAKSLQSCPI